MGRKKNEKLEFRFYDIPLGSSALALLGDDWVCVYGQADECLHFHTLFEIGYCHFGRGKLILGGEELPFEDAMISIIPPNYPHSIVSEGEASWEFLFSDPRNIILELYRDDPKRQAEMLIAAAKRPLLLRIDEHPDLASIIWRILEEAREKRRYSQDVIRSLLTVALLELIRIQEGLNAADPWGDRSHEALLHITPALSYIEENSAREVHAGDLARQCGLSEPHFRRIFEQFMNMPPMDYLNLVRIRHACELMDRKHIPMDLVAEESGFSSVSAFTRNFKKFLGTTPYQWKLQRETRGLSLQDYAISAHKGWDSV
ncbi:MAG: helix-turn-helix transcriptional regulator [Oscillospiraceae bacterium]|nr:helix-turn-helix transcriptional regulator [Oscillospiraceae bacterium]